MTNQRERKRIENCQFGKGLELTETDWDFFSKIDADVLPNDYFERLFNKFSDNPNQESLAVHANILSKMDPEKRRRFRKTHTRGGLKTIQERVF